MLRNQRFNSQLWDRVYAFGCSSYWVVRISGRGPSHEPFKEISAIPFRAPFPGVANSGRSAMANAVDSLAFKMASLSDCNSKRGLLSVRHEQILRCQFETQARILVPIELGRDFYCGVEAFERKLSYLD